MTVHGCLSCHLGMDSNGNLRNGLMKDKEVEKYKDWWWESYKQHVLSVFDTVVFPLSCHCLVYLKF